MTARNKSEVELTSYKNALVEKREQYLKQIHNRNKSSKEETALVK